MISVEKVYSFWMATLACMLLLGCGSDPQYETVRGLQEENRVLKEQLKTIQSQRESGNKEWSEKIEELKKTHDEQVVKEKELNTQKLATIRSELSSLRLRFSAVERENITLKEIVDSEPRIKSATETHVRNDIWVFVVLLGIALIMVVFFIMKYKAASDRLNLLTMKQVSELRRIGGKE